jgi:hypothetical protein
MSVTQSEGSATPPRPKTRRASGSTRTAILAAKAAAKATGRQLAKRPRPSSAVTSGRRLFLDQNPHSPWSRRYRDLVKLFSRDLSGGEITTLSTAKAVLIRRCAAITCELELLDSALARGEAIDLPAYAAVSGHLKRILECLGLERRARLASVDVLPAEVPFSPLRARHGAEGDDAAA